MNFTSKRILGKIYRMSGEIPNVYVMFPVKDGFSDRFLVLPTDGFRKFLVGNDYRVLLGFARLSDHIGAQLKFLHNFSQLFLVTEHQWIVHQIKN